MPETEILLNIPGLSEALHREMKDYLFITLRALRGEEKQSDTSTSFSTFTSSQLLKLQN